MTLLLPLLIRLLSVVVCAGGTITQLCHNLRVLHIRDTYVDRIVIIIIRITITGTIHILVVGETRWGRWYRWRHCWCRYYRHHLSRRSCRGLYVGVERCWSVCIAGLDAQLLLVVVLLEIAFQATRQLQLIDAIIRGIRYDGSTGQLLQ